MARLSSAVTSEFDPRNTFSTAPRGAVLLSLGFCKVRSNIEVLSNAFSR